MVTMIEKKNLEEKQAPKFEHNDLTILIKGLNPLVSLF
jgi:hypothetical protein